MQRPSATRPHVVLFAFVSIAVAPHARAQSLAPGVAADLVLEEVVGDLVNPQDPNDRGVTAAEFLPDGRLVILKHTGEIRVRETNGNIVEAGTMPVNIASERGLLGLAVDPEFATSNRIYLYYSQASS